MKQDQDRELMGRLKQLPRSIEPPRDLWPGIHQRIDAGKLVTADFESRRRGASLVWRRGLLAAAASLLVVVSSMTTAWWMRSSSTLPSAALEAGAAVPAGWAEFAAAEGEYQRVTDELLASLEERRDRLSPETVRIVEDNLRLIDAAIKEAREALERDPADAGLATTVTDIYRRRVDFLRQINRL